MNRSEDRLLPVPYNPACAREAQAQGRPASSQGAPRAVGAFAAQVLGQHGQKRGLRGGEPVLMAARQAYLGAEYCGEHDRRPPVGLIRRATV